MFISMQKKGQSTVEYALIIAVIVAALIAMQTYFKRGVQGRLKQASDDIGEQFSAGASTYDYTTTTNIVSNEVTVPGASQDVHGGITTTSTQQHVDRQGTEVVATYDHDSEYWPTNEPE